MWKICGHELNPGEKKQVILEPGVMNYQIPCTLICGMNPGKTLMVTAGIHSGEYPGIPAVIRLAAEIDPFRMQGNLILMHCVNTSGFFSYTQGQIPEDGFNLNGDYPGSSSGTTGQRIADYFIRELFPKVDFIMDLHSGGNIEHMGPCLFFPTAPKVRETALAAAMSLNIPYLIESTAKTGEYSYAANYHDVPGLLVERGFGNQCYGSWVHDMKHDIELLLNHLNIYTMSAPEDTCRKIVFTKTIYLTSDHRGLWYPAVCEGTRIEKGQLIGRVEDFFGNLIAEYRAECDCVVFYHMASLAVVEGKTLAALGLMESAEEAVQTPCVH